LVLKNTRFLLNSSKSTNSVAQPTTHSSETFSPRFRLSFELSTKVGSICLYLVCRMQIALKTGKPDFPEYLLSNITM